MVNQVNGITNLNTFDTQFQKGKQFEKYAKQR